MAKNFCVEHQTVWFKKGSMKGYAHPIKDEDGQTTGWCNRPKDYEETEEEPVENKPKEIPGQQIGMTVKLIGDLIVAGKLSELFGKEAGWELIKWFRSEVLGTTKVPFDGAKLPQPKKEPTPAGQRK